MRAIALLGSALTEIMCSPVRCSMLLQQPIGQPPAVNVLAKAPLLLIPGSRPDAVFRSGHDSRRPRPNTPKDTGT
jgi:hypothetical protein